MRRSDRPFVPALALTVVSVVTGCSSSEEPATGDGGEFDSGALVDAPASDASSADATTRDDGSLGHDGGDDASDEDAATDAAPDGGAEAGPREPAVFLEAADYSDLVVLHADFPFGVTRRHAADADILGSRWGRHGGPMVTTAVYGADGGRTPAVVAWTLPTGATAAATSSARPFTRAPGLPTPSFYGADGMVDLPFGSLALLSYTGSGTAYPGEALLYNATYTTIRARAFANGFYSGVGVIHGGASWIVYSGLSPLASASSTTSSNGLYVADVCGAAFFGASCPPPRKVFGWNGMSGPVAVDMRGNVFVAASLASAATSNAVYGVSADAITRAPLAKGAEIVTVDSFGTSSLAATAPDGPDEGWVVGLGFDEDDPVYAASFTDTNGTVARGSHSVPAAITKGPAASALSVFSDVDGDPWIAVTHGSTGSYLELRRRAR